MESDGPIFEQVDDSKRTNLSRFKAIGAYLIVMLSSSEVGSFNTYGEHRTRSLVAGLIGITAGLGALYETAKLETTNTEPEN